MKIQVGLPNGETEEWDDVLDAVPEEGNLLILSEPDGGTQTVVTRNVDGLPEKARVAAIYAAGAWVRAVFGDEEKE